LNFESKTIFYSLSLAYAGMRSFRVTANAKVATVMGLIPVSSDTVEAQGRRSADEAVVKKLLKKFMPIRTFVYLHFTLMQR
jgi:hypothetical protein